MNELTYVRANPTGNITLLVTSFVDRKDQPRVSAEMMKALECEQVGFIENAGKSTALCRLQMMGGEFCGNATVSAAALMARKQGIAKGKSMTVPLEVSGCGEVLNCRVTNCGEYDTGTVKMPRVSGIEETPLGMLVRMDGIAHLIVTEKYDAEKAEKTLRCVANSLEEDACGLLQWVDGFMTPLVYVKKTGSMVWETSCASGSTAIGCVAAAQVREEITVTEVRQPGGKLRVDARLENGTVTEAFLTGEVRLMEEGLFQY